jgi:hypothetical protein
MPSRLPKTISIYAKVRTAMFRALRYQLRCGQLKSRRFHVNRFLTSAGLACGIIPRGNDRILDDELGQPARALVENAPSAIEFST